MGRARRGRVRGSTSSDAHLGALAATTGRSTTSTLSGRWASAACSTSPARSLTRSSREGPRHARGLPQRPALHAFGGQTARSRPSTRAERAAATPTSPTPIEVPAGLPRCPARRDAPVAARATAPARGGVVDYVGQLEPQFELLRVKVPEQRASSSTRRSCSTADARRAQLDAAYSVVMKATLSSLHALPGLRSRCPRTRRSTDTIRSLASGALGRASKGTGGGAERRRRKGGHHARGGAAAAGDAPLAHRRLPTARAAAGAEAAQGRGRRGGSHRPPQGDHRRARRPGASLDRHVPLRR